RGTVRDAVADLPRPTAVPPTRPTPAPTAAPVPGRPATAPIAAPAAAPTAVPMAAPPTALVVAACPVVVPAACDANCRQIASSDWKTSNGFPVPGKTMTLGPVGTVAQAVNRSAVPPASSADRPLRTIIATSAEPAPNLPRTSGRSGNRPWRSRSNTRIPAMRAPTAAATAGHTPEAVPRRPAAARTRTAAGSTGMAGPTTPAHRW